MILSNFALMYSKIDFNKIIIISAILLLSLKVCAGDKLRLFKEDSIYIKEHRIEEVLKLKQISGRRIDLVGIETPINYYTETIDGYTVIMDKEGVYQFAEQNSDGDLVLSGQYATNPNDDLRTKQKKFLKKLKLHLRYEDVTLIMMVQKHKRQNAEPKIKRDPEEYFNKNHKK